MSESMFKVKGEVSVSVLKDGIETPVIVRQPNLILDQGMLAIASRSWADSIIGCAAGTLATATPMMELMTPKVTVTSGSALIVSGTDYAFTGLVGRLVRVPAVSLVGKIVSVDSSSGHVEDSATLDIAAAQSGSAKDVYIYQNLKTGLENEVTRVGIATGADALPMSSTTLVDYGIVSYSATYDFPAETGETPYAQVAICPSTTASAADAFSVITLSTPVTVPVGGQLRVSYTLRVRLAPWAMSAGITAASTLANIAGYASAVVGQQAVQAVNVDTLGTVIGFTAYNTCLEPSATPKAALLSFASPGSAIAVSGAKNAAFASVTGPVATAVVDPVGVRQAGGAFSLTKGYTFPTGSSNVIWNALALLGSDGTIANAGFVVAKSSGTLTKTSTQRLTLNVTQSWSRE